MNLPRPRPPFAGVERVHVVLPRAVPGMDEDEAALRPSAA